MAMADKGPEDVNLLTDILRAGEEDEDDEEHTEKEEEDEDEHSVKEQSGEEEENGIVKEEDVDEREYDMIKEEEVEEERQFHVELKKENGDKKSVLEKRPSRKIIKKTKVVRGSRLGAGSDGGLSMEDSLERLAAERRKLERENEEKKRQLERLMRKEAAMLKAAAKEMSSDSNDESGDDDIDEEEQLQGHEEQAEDEHEDHEGEGEEEERVSDEGREDDEEMEEEEEEEASEEDYVTEDVASGCEDDEEDARSDIEGKEADSTHERPPKSHGHSDGIVRSGGDRSRAKGSPTKLRQRSKISPIEWKRSKSKTPPTSSGASKARSRRSSSHRSAAGDRRQSRIARGPRAGTPPSREYLSKIKYLYKDSKYFLIKSNNYENVLLAQAKGIWSTPPMNEERLNTAFKTSSNVILIFSVKESGKFQGFARIAAVSDRNHPPIRWVLPVGLSARALNGVFTIDWINRKELSFGRAIHIRNAWNFDQPVKIGRDGQEIDPQSGEELCRQFLPDKKVDINLIVQKAKKALKENGKDKEKDRTPPAASVSKEIPPSEKYRRIPRAPRTETGARRSEVTDDRRQDDRRPPRRREMSGGGSAGRYLRADSPPAEKRRRSSPSYRDDRPPRLASDADRRLSRDHPSDSHAYNDRPLFNDYKGYPALSRPYYPPAVQPLFSAGRRMRTDSPSFFPRDLRDFPLYPPLDFPSSMKGSSHKQAVEEFLYRASHPSNGVSRRNHSDGRHKDGRR